MTLIDWLPAATSTGLLTAALWLARRLIAERLTAGVKHEYEVKLEQVRSEIRASEERANAQRTTVLASLTESQSALTARRLDAIDSLWSSAMGYRTASPAASAWFGVFRIENLAKHSSDPKVQELAHFVEKFSLLGAEKDKVPAVGTARLYVSASAWLTYNAYTSVISLALVQIQAVKAGLDPLKFTKSAESLELVKAALPAHAKLVEEFGLAALAGLLPDLEEQLLTELKASAAGRESDPESVERASRVERLLARQTIDGLSRRNEP